MNSVLWIDVKDGTEAQGKTKMNRREIDAVAAQLERMQQNLQGYQPQRVKHGGGGSHVLCGAGA